MFLVGFHRLQSDFAHCGKQLLKTWEHWPSTFALLEKPVCTYLLLVRCETAINAEYLTELVPTKKSGSSGESISSGLTFMCGHLLWMSSPGTIRTSSWWIGTRVRCWYNARVLQRFLCFLEGSNLRSDAKIWEGGWILCNFVTHGLRLFFLNTVQSTIVTMSCIKSSELIHLIVESL